LSCSFSHAFSSRDIKTQNVLLNGFDTDEPDGVSVAKVADFGTVREDTRNSDGMLRTSVQTHASTRNIIGTSPYIAPEYLRKGHVSEKTDAYALGVRGHV
jgi:serine/threonine protein kinase